jgi:hypothetical protein
MVGIVPDNGKPLQLISRAKVSVASQVTPLTPQHTPFKNAFDAPFKEFQILITV